MNFYTKLFFAIASLFLIIISCKKSKIVEDSCSYNSCDARRKTLMVATDWRGTLGYYNDLRKWAVNVSVPNTIDGLRTCIICTDLSDSLKVMGKSVTFSGELKELQ